MKVVVQRVSRACVRIEDETVASIEAGLLILVGIARGDTEEAARSLARKIARLRIFDDDQGRMNRSLMETGGSALVVSQFTLLADTRRGRRPGWEGAVTPERARVLYRLFAEELGREDVSVATGRFGTRMEVELINQGPVTLVLEEP